MVIDRTEEEFLEIVTAIRQVADRLRDRADRAADNALDFEVATLHSAISMLCENRLHEKLRHADESTTLASAVTKLWRM